MVWFDAKRTYVYFGDTLGLFIGITFSMYHTIRLWIVDSAAKYTLICQYKIKRGSCILVLLFDFPDVFVENDASFVNAAI